jgi:hypothetical protein
MVIRTGGWERRRRNIVGLKIDRAKLFRAVRWLRNAPAVEVDAVSSAAVLGVSVSVRPDRRFALDFLHHLLLHMLARSAMRRNDEN